MGDWFYVSGEAELGPFSVEQVQELLARGEIGPETMLRKKSWMDWQRAASVELLAEPPTPPQSTEAEQPSADKTDADVLADVPLTSLTPEEPGFSVLMVAAIGGILVAIAALGVYLATRQGETRPPVRQTTNSEPDVAGPAHPASSAQPTMSLDEIFESIYDESSAENEEFLDWLDWELFPHVRPHAISAEDDDLRDWLEWQFGSGTAAAKPSAKR
jgi:hypothetical protein